MKKSKVLIAVIAFGSLIACCNDDIKSVVDCFGESLLLDVHHSKATENPKQVSFEVSYLGDHSLDGTIKWNFDDGTAVETLTGTTATHTYTSAGTYHATATVSLNGGGCSYDVKETVTID